MKVQPGFTLKLLQKMLPTAWNDRSLVLTALRCSGLRVLCHASEELQADLQSWQPGKIAALNRRWGSSISTGADLIQLHLIGSIDAGDGQWRSPVVAALPTSRLGDMQQEEIAKFEIKGYLRYTRVNARILCCELLKEWAYENRHLSDRAVDLNVACRYKAFVGHLLYFHDLWAESEYGKTRTKLVGQPHGIVRSKNKETFVTVLVKVHDQLAKLQQTLEKASGRAEGAGETPFWEELDRASTAAPTAAPVEEVEVAEKDEVELPGYEQANHLKGQGKDKFARGEVEEAMTCWLQGLESLPPSACPKKLLGLLPGLKQEAEEEDHRIRELRVALLSNLALGSLRQKQYRPAVGFCDEVLLEESGNVKALYRKTEALGELCAWQEAEEAAAKLQQSGEEAGLCQAQRVCKLIQLGGGQVGAAKAGGVEAQATSSRWPAEEDVENAKPKESKADTDANGAVPNVPNGAKNGAKEVAVEAWKPPKIEVMSTFDLRKKTITWEEEEDWRSQGDFCDKVWKNSIGRKEAAFFQKRALPLSLLAASALADLDVLKTSELIVHCFLDGNIAPFSDPHDWSIFLKRCPEVRNILVVYIDIGAIGADKDGQPPASYGTLLRPTEEGRIGDRVARAARFMGSYKEFKAHCRDLPGLVKAHVALWADVPLYGFHDDDFSTRLQALNELRSEGIPCVFTFGGEIQEPQAPPMPQSPGLDLRGVGPTSGSMMAEFCQVST
eukprot:s15_g13.t1